MILQIILTLITNNFHLGKSILCFTGMNNFRASQWNELVQLEIQKGGLIQRGLERL